MTDSAAFNEWERQAWEQRADAYSDGLVSVTVGSVAALLDAVAAGSGMRLLDVGCGPGVVSAAAVARGSDVVGVDQAEAMLVIARQRVPSAEFRSGSAESLPAADGEFDAVCGNYVLPHLGDPRRGVAEALRVLKPGGRAAFTEWNAARHEAFRVFWNLLEGSGMPLPSEAPAGPSVSLAEPASMTDAFAAAAAVDVAVHDVTWTVSVDPDEYWDVVLRGTPRTGARINNASPAERAELRRRYDTELLRFPHEGTRVVLPCAAILGVGTKP